MKHEHGLAYIAFAIVCVVWGTTYLAIRVAIETIPPLLMTGARYTIAGAILLIAARFRREPLPRDARTIANLAIIGVLMVGVGNLAVVIAEQWVPSGMAALFVATAPFWATLIAALSGSGERIGVASAIGMLAGFAGVGLLVTPRGAGGHYDSKFILGAVIVQIGSIGWQYGTHRAKYTIRNVPFVTSTALQMLIGGLLVDAAGLAIGEGARFHVNARTLAALVYLALIGSVVAYSAYVFAVKHLPTTKMSLYAYVNPVVAVVLGFLILHEPLTWVSILAMVIILGGTAAVQLSRMRPSLRATVEMPAPRRKNAA
ncbi:MAG TPA: EamA family transporter [Thermoanaerobaculia bacterium]|nr:EamA family transporter [Thermoanaerobaculia bacterium]